ncbi:hypothetical protein [Lysinibacillus sp. BW-2-10]|uniref:hypothetical protein n=1 Tax=Lysinibacillus sp. BW-2-10 TaxID=2590030 RepID=UPI00117D2470|nr:hypothetical protein [Lysinibacillus sp. BW-2-10]TSI02581.1 hypothetical protein FJQ64_18505 [Lysinibacillus sp. BW-2-10]
MKSYSLNYYITVWLILFVIFVSTIIKVFIDVHPLRFIFIVLFVIGLLVGYFRYIMRLKKDSLKEGNKLKRFGLLLFFILIYMAIKTSVSEFVSSEVSSQDYGVVLAFFILGLFISYYALYSINLLKVRKTGEN